MKISKLFGISSVALAVTAVCFTGWLSGCKKSEPLAEIQNSRSDFKVLNFQQVGGKDFIRLVSADECEVSHESGIYLCKYSRQDDKLRIIVEALGTTQVIYMDVDADGLRSPEGKLAYVVEGANSANAKDAATKAQCVISIRNIQQLVRSSQYMQDKKPGDPIAWSELVGPDKGMKQLPTCPVHGPYKLLEFYPQIGCLAAECVNSGPEHKHIPHSFSDW